MKKIIALLFITATLFSNEEDFYKPYLNVSPNMLFMFSMSGALNKVLCVNPSLDIKEALNSKTLPKWQHSKPHMIKCPAGYYTMRKKRYMKESMKRVSASLIGEKINLGFGFFPTDPTGFELFSRDWYYRNGYDFFLIPPSLRNDGEKYTDSSGRYKEYSSCHINGTCRSKCGKDPENLGHATDWDCICDFYPECIQRAPFAFDTNQKWGALFMGKGDVLKKPTMETVFGPNGIFWDLDHLRETTVGGNPMGSALVKVWDYFYNSQEKLLSCRPNIAVLLTAGANNKDAPLSYMTDPAFWDSRSSCNGNYESGSRKGNLRLCCKDSYCRGRSGGVVEEYTSFKGYLKMAHTGSTSSEADSLYTQIVAKYLYDDHINVKDVRKKGGMTNLKERLYHTENIGDGNNCPDGDCEGNRIRTFPIAFMDDKSISTLKKVVKVGGADKVRTPQNVNELIDSVKEVVNVAGSLVKMASAAVPSITKTGNACDNILYMSSFLPSKKGHWWGTLNKSCVHGKSSDNCVLLDKADDNREYPPNANAKEIYSDKSYGDVFEDNPINGFSTGVNYVLKNELKSKSREIIAFDGSSFYNWSTFDDKLDNFMNGCEYQSPLCIPRPNPMGDFWHSSVLTIDQDSKRYLIAGSNAGFLHVFDADTGKENKAIIPRHSLVIKHEKGDFAISTAKGNMHGVDLTPLQLKTETFDWTVIGYRRGAKGYTFIKTHDLVDNIVGKSALLLTEAVDPSGSVIGEFGFSFEGLSLLTINDKSYVAAQSGYHGHFDIDTLSASLITLKPDSPKFHIYIAGIGSAGLSNTSEDSNVYPNSKSSYSGIIYPVIGKVFPFSYDDAKFKDIDTSNVTVNSSNLLYYVDFIGNLFSVDFTDEDKLRKVFSLMSISGQSEMFTSNRNLLKVFGSAKPIQRDSSHLKGSDNREVWIYFGSGDRSRIAKSSSGNQFVGIKDFSFNSSDSSDKHFAVGGFRDATNEDAFVSIEHSSEDFSDSKGWYINFPDNTMVIGSSTYYRNQESSSLFFVTYTKPDPPTEPAQESCKLSSNNLGYSCLWEVSAFNGRAIRKMKNNKTHFLGDDRVVSCFCGIASEPIINCGELYVGLPGCNDDSAEVPDIDEDIDLDEDVDQDVDIHKSILIPLPEKEFSDQDTDFPDEDIPPPKIFSYKLGSKIKESSKVLWWKIF